MLETLRKPLFYRSPPPQDLKTEFHYRIEKSICYIGINSVGEMNEKGKNLFSLYAEGVLGEKSLKDRSTESSRRGVNHSDI